MASKGVFWIGTGLVGIVLLSLIASLLGRSSTEWCNLSINAGQCQVYDGKNCYCIDTFGSESDTNLSKQFSLYQHSQNRCSALKGRLASGQERELVMWLAKRMFQMGVDTAVIGLRKTGGSWFWTHEEQTEEATDIDWRADFPPNSMHTQAVMTVESVRISEDYYQYGMQYYLNYEYYLQRDRSYQWFGFSTIDDVFNTDAFYICQYAEDSLLKTTSDEEKRFELVERSSDPRDPCYCSAHEAIQLSTAHDSATFQTPGYPRNYCSDNNCRWIITISPGYAIQLEWLVFSTEHKMDFVYVYDGETDDGPRLITCSGWTCSSQESSSNAMQVHFHSDHVTTELGFKAKVTGIKRDECYCSESKTVSLVNLYETFTLLSPKYPQPYCANQHCGWTIMAQENYGLQLRWNAFDTLSDAHFVSLYDGDNIVERCSGDTCGDVLTTGHILGVEFVTDGTPTGHMGFHATITVVNNYCERHPKLSDDEASISYSAEGEHGIPTGANATLRCAQNRKIKDTHDQTSLVLTCHPPQWSHNLPSCIPVCHIEFLEIINLHDVHLCATQNEISTMMVVDDTVTLERFDLINQVQITVDDFTCTNSGWSPEIPIECDNINSKQDLGKILLIAGEGLSNIVSFYPSIPNKKEVMADLGEVRQGHIAVMYDGMALIAGGNGGSGQLAYSSGFLFDTQTKSFIVIEDMGSARSDAAAAEFDNSVVVCGGHSENDETLNTCEQFRDGQWHWMSPMIKPRNGFALLNLDEKLCAVGGWVDNLATLAQSMECWESEKGWTELDTTIPMKHSFSAVVFHNNIILCGGSYYGITDFGCDRYNPGQEKWFAFPTLRKARKDHSMISAFGTMYVFGGTGVSDVPVETVEVYDTHIQSWHQISSSTPMSNRIRSAVVALGMWKDMESYEEEFEVRGSAIFDLYCSGNDHNTSIICPKGNVTSVSGARQSCLYLGDPMKPSLYMDGACLVLYPLLKYSQIDADAYCSDVHGPNAHLAVISNRMQMNTSTQLLVHRFQEELSDGVWMAGTRDVEWGKTVDGKHVSTITTPFWAYNFPKEDQGDGILLTNDGMMNAEVSSHHPFMCQINLKTQQTEFVKGNKHGRTSPSMGEPLLELTESALDLYHCAFECSRNMKCKSFAHNNAMTHCLMYWLPSDDIFLIDDDDFRIFDRRTVGEERNCLDPSDCTLSASDPPKLLLVSHGPVVSFEGYYPGQSYFNSIIYTTTEQKTYPVAVMLDSKVIITAHFHNNQPDELSLAKDTIIYDPKTNTVSSSGFAVQTRHEPAAAELNHAVIMCGGMTSRTSCERFTDGQWSMMTASLNVGRWAFRMVNLHNKLYAIGGWGDGGFIAIVERYDATSDAWTTLDDPLPIPRHSPGVTIFRDEIVVCGGAVTGGIPTFDCHTYSDVTDQWLSMAAMITPRERFVLVAFQEYIYALGGSWYGDASVEKFHSPTGQWIADSDTIQNVFAAAFVV